LQIWGRHWVSWSRHCSFCVFRCLCWGSWSRHLHSSRGAFSSWCTLPGCQDQRLLAWCLCLCSLPIVFQPALSTNHSQEYVALPSTHCFWIALFSHSDYELKFYDFLFVFSFCRCFRRVHKWLLPKYYLNCWTSSSSCLIDWWSPSCSGFLLL